MLCMMTVKYSRDPHILISVSILAQALTPGLWSELGVASVSLYDNNSQWPPWALHRHTQDTLNHIF